MTIAFHTLGCKVNQYETQAMRRLLEQAGYTTEEYSDDGEFDCLVVNSCTVTGESDRKLRQLIRRWRRHHPSAIIVLTGCMPQAHSQTAAAFKEADIVLGNASRRDIVKHITAFITHRQRILDIPPHGTIYEPLNIDAFQGRTRAYVKIQDGCNRFCSYCIIPYARGRVRSRPLDDIQRELARLAAVGYKEVVLVGINLTAYGQDCGLNIADAVEVACQVDGIRRVRLGSLEPDFMTEAILERLAKQDKLCPQFHVALQSGCDDTLRRMNRHYTTKEYTALCMRLRELFPGCAITTDVMVGFPGETDEEFESSLGFVKSINFTQAHVFAYSRRPGTVADKLSVQIPKDIKAERSRRMIAATEETAKRYAATQVGRTREVLLETPQEDGTVIGHTETYLTVHVKTTRQPGSLLPVYITGVQDDGLVGREM